METHLIDVTAEHALGVIKAQADDLMRLAQWMSHVGHVQLMMQYSDAMKNLFDDFEERMDWVSIACPVCVGELTLVQSKDSPDHLFCTKCMTLHPKVM